jgi:hypothetical protein
VRQVQAVLYPIIQQWANNRLLSVHPSGSFMKGTANKSGTDIDLFISLSEETTETLKEIYNLLFDTMKANGYPPTRQNVSINVSVNGYLRDRFLIARVVDPANTNNIISEDLSLADKMKITQAARQALNAKNWGDIGI